MKLEVIKIISYKPLLKLMIDRDIKKQDIIKDLNISSATMAKISKNENISLEVIEKLCNYFDVQPGDIIEHTSDK